MKRIEVNDPVALRQMGFRRYAEGNYKGAFEYHPIRSLTNTPTSSYFIMFEYLHVSTTSIYRGWH